MNSQNKYIEQIAQEALKKTGNSLPINVEEIARGYGLEVVEFAFHEKISGLLKKEQGIIGVNKTHHPVRRRFTIAHELGHFLLGHGMETMDEIIDESFDRPMPQEREANLFASCLLIPSDLMKKESKKGIDLEKLSGTFGVSKQAITIRLLDLKLI